MQDSKDVLRGLKQSFEAGFIEDTFDIAGHKWTMRTLNGMESLWRDGFVDLSITASFLSSRRVPTLAIAIKKIDDRNVTDIFISDDISPTSKSTPVESVVKSMSKSRDDFKSIEFTSAEELKKFIETSIPDKVINDLWAAFNTLEEKESLNLEGALDSKEKSFRKDGSTGRPNLGNEAEGNV